MKHFAIFIIKLLSGHMSSMYKFVLEQFLCKILFKPTQFCPLRGLRKGVYKAENNWK